jgi:hypothetical protein
MLITAIVPTFSISSFVLIMAPMPDKAPAGGWWLEVCYDVGFRGIQYVAEDKRLDAELLNPPKFREPEPCNFQYRCY